MFPGVSARRRLKTNNDVPSSRVIYRIYRACIVTKYRDPSRRYNKWTCSFGGRHLILQQCGIKIHQDLKCMYCSPQKRLQKELLALQNDPPPGMTLNEKSVQNTITQWIVDMEGAPGTLYEGEKFQLLFKFSSRYPFDSPQVMFTGENIPVHPHVYSNGHICLSILTEDWSPALSVQSVCLSIISMLSSCKEKRRPPDNSFYVRTCNKNPKKTKWWYHDDTC
nr:PREDICTED: ubiquitin-conjugating enzyme E2 W isoform X1 [Lepisosteus oculatus]